MNVILFCLVIREPTVQEKKASVSTNTHEKKSTRKLKTPTLKDLVDAAFETELNVFHESKLSLEIGDAVLARMRGYMPWPGRVESFSSNNKIINCFFFGTNNAGPVGSKNIVPFSLAHETVRLVCSRPPNAYVKGVKEIESECGVPAELSCLKEFKSIKP